VCMQQQLIFREHMHQAVSIRAYASGRVYPGRVHPGRVHPGRMHPGRIHPGRIHPGRIHHSSCLEE
jgi:hypothetical protein